MLPPPIDRAQLRSFLGMVTFIRRFIPDFAAMAAPLSELLMKDEKFVWTSFWDLQFNKLKEALMLAPILQFPDPTCPYHIKTDASDFAVGGVL